MHEKKNISIHECKCFNPDIRLLYKNEECSQAQIEECHGREVLQSTNHKEDSRK